ncbi:exosome complex exonuclease [Grosmannia clavigera kw1407]|uniref:Exosome complex exonuclease n=1 Tax=Grosmannia clavigera (strain kw1407 / UAMH 11150) TaxID=655863 RepID=F0XKH8_GROCL|nr:exosome complex exonuclease [Grosmannia clavigera kw1407]EFX01648.1 exosome complex exonuclease [Grosmannia clavigera kw1407]
MASIVLPGDDVDPTALLPPADKKPLRLGPGLRVLLPEGRLVATVPGLLAADRRKNLLWVEAGGRGGRYAPATGDLVVGQVQHASADQAVVALAAHDAPPLRAVLPVLAFAGASRKNRPDLQPGTLVYARVAFAARHMDTELECVDGTTGKADGLGPLLGGMVFAVSLQMARRLLMASSAASGIVVLEALAQEGLAFETAVGRNGRLWVRSATATATATATADNKQQKQQKQNSSRNDSHTVILVGRAVTATDAGNLDPAQQRALVRKFVRGGG